jgi:hypothetical protein
MKQISIGLAVLCLCVLSLQAYADDREDVHNLAAHETSLWEAIKKGDMNTFSLGVYNELMDIDASGVVYNKQQLLDALGKMKMTDYTLSDFKTFKLDDDCVVLTYTSNSTATMDGKTMTMKAINSSTYVEHDGKWLPMFHSETIIPAPMN